MSRPDIWRMENGRPHLNLHKGQKKAWLSERRFVVILAGTQSGKTVFLPWWLAREVERCGAGDYLAVTASFDLFRVKFLRSIREVFEHILKRGRYWAGDKVMELADPEGKFWAEKASDPMWGRILLRSASAGSGLESATANAAILDEAGMDEFGLEEFEAVLRRLSIAQGRVLIGTTIYNLGWLKTQLYDRWLAGDQNIEVVQFHSKDNPAFPPEEQERAKASMPAWRYRMFYEGEFSKPAGMIYEDFDETLHTCQPFEIPQGWPLYFGHDFGGANTAVVWLVHDVDADRFFVVRESLEGGKSTREHVRALREATHGLNTVAAWGGAPSEGQFRWDWTAEGWEISEPPIKDVEPGIDRVTQLLKERRIQVFKTCTGLLDEFGSYRRKLDANGQPTEEIQDKRSYHRLDSLRYCVSALVSAPSFTPVVVTGGEREMGLVSYG